MPVPPRVSELGVLRLEEVVFAYDGPRVFTARSRTGQLYFAVSVDEDEETGLATYLYVPISDHRYLAARSGLVRTRDLFLDPEDGRLAVVRQVPREDAAEIHWLSPSEAPSEWLPTEDARLTLDTPTVPVFDPEALEGEAAAEGRLRFALRLLNPPSSRSEYPVRPLVGLMTATQESVETLVHRLRSDEPSKRGPLPQTVIEDAELSLVGLQAASFVLLLAPSRTDALFDAPDLVDALADFLDILEQCDDPVELSRRSGDLGVRATGKLREFLEVVVDSGSDVAAYFAPPGRTVRHALVTRSSARAGLEALESAGFDVQKLHLSQAELIGVNLRTGVFELHELDVRKRRFIGRIDEQARDQIAGLPTGSGYTYEAEIESEETYSTVTSEIKVKHRLLAISKRSGGSA